MSMSLNKYQELASKTAIYPGRGTFVGLMYVTGKLAGEAGEFSENTFKALRDDDIVRYMDIRNNKVEDGEVNGFVQYRAVHESVTVTFGTLQSQRRAKAIKELGDCLWYVAQAAFELGFTLEEIASANIDKLAARKVEGTLQGSGSER